MGLSRARAVACFVALGLAVGSGASLALSTHPAIAQDSAQDARSDREKARAEKAAAAAELDAANADDAAVAEALQAITDEVNAQQLQVRETQRQLDLNQVDLTLATEAINARAQRQVEVEAQLAQSAVEGFVSSQVSSSGWLESEDLGQTLRAEALLEDLNADTSDLLEELRVLREDQEIAQTTAEVVLARTSELEVNLSLVLVDLQDQQEVQAVLKAEMEARIAVWQTELANAQAEEQRLSDFIRAEEAKAAEPAPAPTPSAGPASGQGFQWPVSASITSSFGYRVHPIYGTRRLHSGIDLGAASGTAIVAAKGGTVISAGWQSGYGNTVVISHGDGITTLYAHQSRVAVSAGQSVGRGEVIGYVGSTGNSTGPHLHFEIRVNGSAVNPRPYLP